ncbi:MAG: YtxH domain-containing protein [Ferruginibacter sp.]
MSPAKVITLLLLGVTAGLLIAPDKGSETRRKFSNLVDDMSDSVQEIIDLFREDAGDITNAEEERRELLL